jgi:hypothetical protein
MAPYPLSSYSTAAIPILAFLFLAVPNPEPLAPFFFHHYASKFVTRENTFSDAFSRVRCFFFSSFNYTTTTTMGQRRITTTTDNLWCFLYHLLLFFTKYFVVVFSFLPLLQRRRGMTTATDNLWYVLCIIYCSFLLTKYSIIIFSFFPPLQDDATMWDDDEWTT